MELRYKSAARNDLEAFINRYEEAFRELYRDTGLWNEEEIISGYERNAQKLYDHISRAIEHRLGVPKVAGRKKIIRSWYEIDVRVGSRLVVVYYSEDRREQIRWIEAISIDRKPIIF